ncbi:DUF6085 family protein [Streptomyces sp. NPDC046925]|uniref:DUF6085 family protein n=1 Tax=Streptomyces sp. NPDC046925 TaxID=3155375 RepID=UPI0033D9B890
MTDVQGHCPACGRASLFLGEGGYVTCSIRECPQPDAVSELLADRETEHIVQLAEEGWTVRHPLIERLDDALMGCQLNAYMSTFDRPDELGTFRAELGKYEAGLWNWEKLS